VALGRAIVRDPDVFLFDEPLSNLDAKMRVQMRAEIARLHHRLGATMVYVTHDQTEAMTLGQRIVVMKDGVVQQVAAPLELYERPANRFVAGFIGSPAMNFLSGHLERAEGLRFVTDTGEAVGMPAAFAPAAALVGPPTILGIRPEHLDLAPAGATAGLAAPVQVVESLGSETMVHLGLAGGAFVVRCAGQATATVDRPLGVNLRADGIRLFAADEQGRALPLA
jgi:multiple sugar transport system ATP-binding protein